MAPTTHTERLQIQIDTIMNNQGIVQLKKNLQNLPKIITKFNESGRGMKKLSVGVDKFIKEFTDLGAVVSSTGKTLKTGLATPGLKRLNLDKIKSVETEIEATAEAAKLTKVKEALTTQASKKEIRNARALKKAKQKEIKKQKEIEAAFREVMAPMKQYRAGTFKLTTAEKNHVKMLNDLGVGYMSAYHPKRLKGMKDMQAEAKKMKKTFSMEFLGVMFGGMMLQRTFMQLATTAQESFMRITEGQGAAANSFHALNTSIELVKFSLGNAIATVLEPLIPTIIAISEMLSDWIENNQELVVGIIKWGLILGTASLILGQTVLYAEALINVFGMKGLLGSIIKMTAAVGAAGKAGGLTAALTTLWDKLALLRTLGGIALIIKLGWDMFGRGDRKLTLSDFLSDIFTGSLAGLLLAGPEGLTIGLTITILIDVNKVLLDELEEQLKETNEIVSQMRQTFSELDVPSEHKNLDILIDAMEWLLTTMQEIQKVFLFLTGQKPEDFNIRTPTSPELGTAIGFKAPTPFFEDERILQSYAELTSEMGGVVAKEDELKQKTGELTTKTGELTTSSDTLSTSLSSANTELAGQIPNAETVIGLMNELKTSYGGVDEILVKKSVVPSMMLLNENLFIQSTLTESLTGLTTNLANIYISLNEILLENINMNNSEVVSLNEKAVAYDRLTEAVNRYNNASERRSEARGVAGAASDIVKTALSYAVPK